MEGYRIYRKSSMSRYRSCPFNVSGGRTLGVCASLAPKSKSKVSIHYRDRFYRSYFRVKRKINTHVHTVSTQLGDDEVQTKHLVKKAFTRKEQFDRMMHIFAAASRVLFAFTVGASHDKDGPLSKGAQKILRQQHGSKVLREELIELGPAFIKLGQAIAARPDVFGEMITSELEVLHDACEPFSSGEAFQVLREELGDDLLSSAFIHKGSPFWETKPVAAASLGQVYKAEVQVDGTDRKGKKTKHILPVAVKVQRPLAREQIELDVAVLRFTAGQVPFLEPIVALVGDTLIQELDYVKEAHNTEEFAQIQKEVPNVIVPKPMRDLSSSRVLTLEWIDGRPPTSLTEDKERLLQMTKIAIQCTIAQLLFSNVLHGDPHGGNLLLTPDNKLAYLDFGVLCRVEQRHARALLSASVHILNLQFKELAYDLADMDVIDAADVPMEEIAESFKTEFSADTGKLSDQMKINNAMMKLGYKYKFNAPSYYTTLIRALAPLEGYGVKADPNFDILGECYPYIMKQICFDNSKQGKRILREFLLTEDMKLRGNLLEDLDLKDIDNLSMEFVGILASSKGYTLRKLLYEAKPPDLKFTLTNMIKLAYAMSVFTSRSIKDVMIPSLLFRGRKNERKRLNMLIRSLFSKPSLFKNSNTGESRVLKSLLFIFASGILSIVKLAQMLLQDLWKLLLRARYLLKRRDAPVSILS